MEQKELVSISTLSQMMDIKERTIKGWIQRREMPYKKVGRLVRIHLGEFREWYNARTVKPVEPEVVRRF